MHDVETNDYKIDDTLDAEYYQAMEELQQDPLYWIESAQEHLEEAKRLSWHKGYAEIEKRLKMALELICEAKKKLSK